MARATSQRPSPYLHQPLGCSGQPDPRPPGSGYLTDVSRYLADDVFVFHYRPGSPLGDTHPSDAGIPVLLLAVTINAAAQGDFGGPGCLELNEIAKVNIEPNSITEFRNKLKQRRWIESGSLLKIVTEPCRSLLREELDDFDTYFQDAPTAGGQGDRVSCKLILTHLTTALINKNWNRSGSIKEENHKLIVPVKSEKGYHYTPRSDFHVSIDQLASLLGEVQSNKNEDDRYRMLLHAACVARLGRHLYNDLFIVVALYITTDGTVKRYFVFQPDSADRRVSYVEDEQNWMEPSELFIAIFELYNLVSVIKRDRPKLGHIEDRIRVLDKEVSATCNDAFTIL
ncbi:hypothetical protein BGY98DRAFT_937576 [Russula aff. rugulosa BPL654]|nr:hypothetical protein BGY98DRAFT_937576 [Russula aff. rugulosa BPL654]